MEIDYKHRYEQICLALSQLSNKIDNKRDITNPIENIEFIAKYIKTPSKKGEWCLYSMYDLIELLRESVKNPSTEKIKLPTTRWGDTTTEFASTDKASIDRGILKLTEKGIKARTKIDKELTTKHKSQKKKFYNLEIFKPYE